MVKSAPIQLKNSRETLSTTGTAEKTKRDAQLVVCAYVQTWCSHMTEEEQADEVSELLDILGIK